MEATFCCLVHAPQPLKFIVAYFLITSVFMGTRAKACDLKWNKNEVFSLPRSPFNVAKLCLGFSCCVFDVWFMKKKYKFECFWTTKSKMHFLMKKILLIFTSFFFIHLLTCVSFLFYLSLWTILNLFLDNLGYK